MSNVELKPCPFCGGDASWITLDHETGEGRVSCISEYGWCDANVLASNKIKGAEQWNTRAAANTTPTAPVRTDALREAAENARTVLGNLVSAEGIAQTTVINAYAQVIEAHRRLGVALNAKAGLTNESKGV
jgi:hypothetical protein